MAISGCGDLQYGQTQHVQILDSYKMDLRVTIWMRLCGEWRQLTHSAGSPSCLHFMLAPAQSADSLDLRHRSSMEGTGAFDSNVLSNDMVLPLLFGGTLSRDTRQRSLDAIQSTGRGGIELGSRASVAWGNRILAKDAWRMRTSWGNGCTPGRTAGAASGSRSPWGMPPTKTEPHIWPRFVSTSGTTRASGSGSRMRSGSAHGTRLCEQAPRSTWPTCGAPACSRKMAAI